MARCLLVLARIFGADVASACVAWSSTLRCSRDAVRASPRCGQPIAARRPHGQPHRRLGELAPTHGGRFPYLQKARKRRRIVPAFVVDDRCSRPTRIRGRIEPVCSPARKRSAGLGTHEKTHSDCGRGTHRTRSRSTPRWPASTSRELRVAFTGATYAGICTASPARGEQRMQSQRLCGREA
jgi:hypothetical protein